MTQEAIRKLTDDQLGDVIIFAQTEQQERADKRREQAIEEITKRAKEAGLQITIKGKKHPTNGKRGLKAGDRFQHPDDPSKIWTVGNGRPPKWLDVAKRVA